jgi:hypothetical protein
MGYLWLEHPKQNSLQMKPLIVFGCVVKWKAVAIRKEDIRFLLPKNRIVR